jgi:hypothetical protein
MPFRKQCRLSLCAVLAAGVWSFVGHEAAAQSGPQPVFRVNMSVAYHLDAWKVDSTPILHTTAKGQIVLIRGQGRDPQHVALASDDQGRTWHRWDAFTTWPELYYSGVVRRGDELLVFGAKDANIYKGTYVWWSKDEGQTWAGGRRLTQDTDPYAPMNQRIVLSSRGLLIVPVEQLLGQEGPGPNRIGTVYSDDGGRSWRRSPIFGPPPPHPDRPEGFGEPAVVELANGKFWMVFRTRLGHLWQAWSTDGGANWGKPSSTGLVSPLAAVNAKRIPGTDAVIIFWNNSQPGRSTEWTANPNIWGPRSPLVFAVSRDNCQTWGLPVIVDPGMAKYPSICFSDREMFVAYLQDPDPNAFHGSKNHVMLAVYDLRSIIGHASTTSPADLAAPSRQGIRLQVQEVPFFHAPRKPLDIWALNICYATLHGRNMLMTRVQVDYRGQHDWRQAIDYNQRMLSFDNGHTWAEQGPVAQNTATSLQTAWMHFLDPDNGFLLGVFAKGEAPGDRPRKLYYEISKDAGRTWSTSREIPCSGRDCNTTRSTSRFHSDVQELSADQPPFAKLDDGTIVCGFELTDRGNEANQGTIFLRAVWTHSGNDLRWEVGETIIGPKDSQPVCEPDLLHLGGQRLFATMRCQGSEKAGAYSTRQCALSQDGGRTWSKTWPMKYDDGSPVFVPASIAAFERDPLTGKVYWFANILDKPVYGQLPRSPLCISEFDTKRLCLIKSTVTSVIPPCTPKPPYSNFGHYRDRETGDFVIIPAEQIPYRVNHQTDHFFAYRIRVLPESDPSR